MKLTLIDENGKVISARKVEQLIKEEKQEAAETLNFLIGNKGQLHPEVDNFINRIINLSVLTVSQLSQ